MSHLASFALDYLFNSLWQIPLLFLCGYLVARLLHPLGPSAEHQVWALTLLLQCLLPACSFSLSSLKTLLVRCFIVPGQHRGSTVTTVVGPASFAALHLSTLPLSAMSRIYAFFLVIVLARFFWRVLAASTLRRTASPFQLSAETERFWRRCTNHFGLETATLATSLRIGSPVTLGLRRKLILLPSTMLGSLHDADLHTVLAHECAHMQRQDFAKNLLYELLSLPVSYHPFALRTRAHLTETREIVCDQLAANLTGRSEYARSLLRLASLLVVAPPTIATHVIGILDAHTFERRLMLLTERSHECHGLRRTLALGVGAVLALTTCTTALALRVSINPNPEPATSSASSASPRAARVPSDVMAGNLLTHVNPLYPQAARDSRIEGSVVLHAIVGKDGTIENLKVTSGPKELQRSALDAVRQWTYKPYLLNGDPTEVETTITVNYSLQP